MKKFVMLLILSLSVMGMLAGCSKDNKNVDSSDGSDEITPTPVVTNDNETNEDDIDAFTPMENPVVKEEYDYNDYIKLGKYKGVEVKVEQPQVTDEDIDVNIQMDLYDNGATPIDVTDRAVKFADTVVMDFVGYHNGEPFAGGSMEDHEITVGSKSFIEGFEEQLVGAELNKEMDINVVFPDNYNNTTLAGEPAIFKITVNSIKYFELTEDFVVDTMGFDNEEAYRESIGQDLLLYQADMLVNKKENDVYTAVINDSEITLPDHLLAYYVSDIKTLYTNIAASYGSDFETFLTLSGSSVEEFEIDAKAYANNMATRELVIKALSTAEGIELTEEEFQIRVAEYTEQYGYESNEAFLEDADVEVLRDDMLFYKIIEFLVSESKEI
jgi:trigger factor